MPISTSAYSVRRRAKKLLEILAAQRKHIFVPRQVADEVLRNKLRLASLFFAEQLKEIAGTKVTVPDHLLGLDEAELAKYRQTFQTVETARDFLRAHANEVLAKISLSTDDVSQRLAPLLESATEPTEEQLRLARIRKELGNPPGKQSDPLGDQVSWEQLLAFVKANEGGLREHEWYL